MLSAATYLHRDGLGSVRAITSAAGVKIESALYKPFGEQSEWVLPGNAAPETKGWIGERYDADAGLQYLNARYYDPELSLFLQPDWFEVTKAGVGTNRYSYSFNDPVNKIDPGGNDAGPPVDPDDWGDEKNPPANTGRSYSEQMTDVGTATADIASNAAYELSPAGAIDNIYSGIRDGNYGQVALGVAEVAPWGKLASKLMKGAAPSMGSVDDLLDNGVKVIGSPQVTRGAGGRNHAAASLKAAIAEVNRLGGPKAVDRVYFDTKFGKIVTGVTSRQRPDVAVRKKDGSLSLIEIASPSQTVGEMNSKLAGMRAMIGSANPGLSVSWWSKTVSDILSGS